MEKHHDQQPPCATSGDPELWFSYSEKNPQPAKQVCRTCPLRVACLAVALHENMRYGVWGGLTPRERAHAVSYLRRQGAAVRLPKEEALTVARSCLKYGEEACPTTKTPIIDGRFVV